VLGAIFGRRRLATSTLGRATTAARGVGRTAKESQDVERAEASLETLRARLAELEAEAAGELAALQSRLDPLTAPLATVSLRPRKADIEVRRVALAWVPEETP
jgi:hypothetical protein